MADKGIEKAEKEAKASAISYARVWGGNFIHFLALLSLC